MHSTARQSLMRATLRANPAYELIPFDQLAPEHREPLRGLAPFHRHPEQ